MTFTLSRLLNHGTENPIVARLSLEIMEILRHCNISQEMQDKIAEIYLNSLVKKLLRCWEIKERFRLEFNAAAEAYKLPTGKNPVIEVPQISRLEEEAHNFLYEAKNYIRDLLRVFSLLYGTDFKEASEFFRARKGEKSVVEFASSAFGEDDSKTRLLQEAVEGVEYFVSLRNAVEHPGGYSGTLRIKNFALEPDGKLVEPTWYLEKDGRPTAEASSIRADMETALHNLLLLGEDIFVSWATENLKAPEFSRLALVPEERRDPKCPIKWVVTASSKLEELILSSGH